MSNQHEKINLNEFEREILKNQYLEMEKRFKIVEEKIDKILEFLETDCKKMSKHIDFVENVYDNVKMPFYYVMDKVNNLVSSDYKKTINDTSES
jgi:uncharacterized protein YjcR